MGSSGQNLTPTLWRTCRALANRRRLRILEGLLQHPGSTVSQVARTARVPMPVASQYLRMLNARGLLRATRAGRSVSYRVEADPLVPQAAVLLRAIDSTFRRRGIARDEVFADLTAFTHPRRIEIMQALARGPLHVAEFARRAGISARTARRHFRKLVRRGFAAMRSRCYERACPDRPLAQALLRLALAAK